MDVREKAKNDKRLIDANALDERFDKRIEWLRLDVHDKYSLGLYHGAATDKDLIGEMPTVDAVEVVRCRECKYHEEEGIEMVYCPNMIGGWVENEWFCANGKWKGDAD